MILRHIEAGNVYKADYVKFERGECETVTVKATKKKPLDIVTIKNLFGEHNGNMYIDMSPIKCMEFPENKRGFTKMKKHMIDRGFSIDVSGWKEYVEDTFS